MGRIGEDLDVEFIISTGDNFYEDGLTGVGDPSFLQSFSQIYNAKSLQKPWYSGMYELINIIKFHYFYIE